MSEPEEYKVEPETDESYTDGNHEPVDGAYHSTGEHIYSDAHYEPAGASTEPPRYYTPPKRTVKEPREKKKRFWPAAIALCLVAALLGGLGGMTLANRETDRKLAQLQAELNQTMQDRFDTVSEEIRTVSIAAAPAAEAGGISPSLIFEQAKRQVVGISTEVTYQNFFGMTSSSAVSGSGFIISEDGYILTNYHVIETAYANNLDVTVMLNDGTEYTAAIVGFEPDNDVALLKIEASGLMPVTFGNSDQILMGETVYAVGNPLGELAYSMSTGTVSGLDRLIVTEDAVQGINMFQIDAAVSPGNSGGPVYNARGEVVGIVTAKSGAMNTEGLGFAIPINDAASIATDLMTKGYVTGKAYMGVRLDERYNSMYAQYYNMPLGAYVYSVDSGSAAETAGLQAGDIITKLGDSEISSYSDLKAAVRGYSAGDTAEITLYRAGESITLSITFDEAVPATTANNGSTVLDPGASEQN